MNKNIEEGQLFHLLCLLIERRHGIRMYSKASFIRVVLMKSDIISKHLKKNTALQKLRLPWIMNHVLPKSRTKILFILKT